MILAALGSVAGFTGLSGFTGLAGDVPVDPDGDQATQWIVEELAKPEYQAAKPTWWDLLSQAIWNWIGSLDFSGLGVLQGPVLAILVLVIVAAIVLALVMFGRPRRNSRSNVVGALFGEDETRDAQALREAARRAADAGDWALAIEELFRSLARTLDERVLVSTLPGTTANGFARMAGEVFPDHAGRLRAGAVAFDDVRYLGAAGSEDDYRALLALEGELRTARPGSAAGGAGAAEGTVLAGTTASGAAG
jgi:hypothetical protein